MRGAVFIEGAAMVACLTIFRAGAGNGAGSATHGAVRVGCAMASLAGSMRGAVLGGGLGGMASSTNLGAGTEGRTGSVFGSGAMTGASAVGKFRSEEHTSEL